MLTPSKEIKRHRLDVENLEYVCFVEPNGDVHHIVVKRPIMNANYKVRTELSQAAEYVIAMLPPKINMVKLWNIFRTEFRGKKTQDVLNSALLELKKINLIFEKQGYITKVKKEVEQK